MMRDFLVLHGAAVSYTIAFALTLALAGRLTPRHWWHRPTLRAGAVLGAGTLAFGALFLALSGVLFGRPPPAMAAVAALPATAAAAPAAPPPGASYRVAEELNLRSERGVHAARLAVLPAGSRVVASGAVDGDWWQVRAHVGGRELAGWTSSLWLRRGDEAVPQRATGH